MARVRAKIEEIILFGMALVRIRSEIEKTPFLVGLWLGLRAKIEKNTLFGRALVRIRSEIENPFW